MEETDLDAETVLVIDVDAVCRLCFESKSLMINVFGYDEDPSKLIEQINFVTDIEITQTDGMPTKVCYHCLFKIEQFYEFKHHVQKSQKTFNNVVSEGLSKKHQDIISQQAVIGDNVENNFNKCNDVLTVTLTEFSNRFQQLPDLNNATSPKIETKYPAMKVALKNNQCLLCLETCNSNDEIKQHVQNHIVGTNLESYFDIPDKNIFCNVCNKMFDYRFNFIEHQREHLNMKPFICEQEGCNASFYNNQSLKHHIVFHSERMFLCSVCNLRFKRKSDLKSHFIIHEDEGLRFHCSICGMICKNRTTLRSHLRKHKSKPKFKCEQCPKLFYSRSERARHTLTHSTYKLFSCDSCNKSYYSKSALIRHKRMCKEIVTIAVIS